MAIRHAIMYHAGAAHAFSAGIKCQHCICGDKRVCMVTIERIRGKCCMQACNKGTCITCFPTNIEIKGYNAIMIIIV